MKRPRGKHAHIKKIPQSINTLASELSDDFNNILTVILGACSLVDSDSNSDPELLKCVYLIRSSAEHAAALSNRLVLECSNRKTCNHWNNSLQDRPI